MSASSCSLRLALIATIGAGAAPAAAQPNESGQRWILTIGGGAYVAPKFPGAEETEVRPLPLFDLRRVGTDPSFETPDQGIDAALIDANGFRLGPAAQFQRGRDEEDAIPGIGDVGRTIEAGVFAEAYVASAFRLRGEVRKGFGGHKGVVGDLGADVIMGSPRDRFHFSVGPRVRFANARYVRAFYGINPNQSALSGLPVHNVNGGLHSAGALASAKYRFNNSWGIEAYSRYDRLLGDAADSPLVQSSLGSRHQFEAGIGLTYSFAL